MTTKQFPVDRLIDQVGGLFAAGGSLGDAFGYTGDEYEAVYTLGYDLYRLGRYQDALKAFGFLAVHDSLNRRFMNAFAATLQMLGRHYDAIAYYSLVSVMDLSDPKPTFHTAECMLHVGMKDEARKALDIVIRQCRTDDLASLKVRAESLLARIDPSQQR